MTRRRIANLVKAVLLTMCVFTVIAFYGAALRDERVARIFAALLGCLMFIVFVYAIYQHLTMEGDKDE